MSRNSTTTLVELALAQVNELAEQVANGNMPLAQQARMTLDSLCWSPDGYPAPVAAALRRKGLRHTAE
jgi:hypothetical protein